MRGRMSDAPSYAPPVDIDAVMVGATVCQIEDSRNPDFEIGEWVLGYSGWQFYAVSDGSDLTKLGKKPENPSFALGILGMPGFTAYMGLLDFGKPKPGDTLVVAAATGPVGARIPVCGLVSRYNATKLPDGPDRLSVLMGTILVKRIKVQGFIIFDDYGHRYDEFTLAMTEMLDTEKIHYREQVVDGLESAPEAFIGMLEGQNFGKLVIKVNDEQ